MKDLSDIAAPGNSGLPWTILGMGRGCCCTPRSYKPPSLLPWKFSGRELYRSRCQSVALFPFLLPARLLPGGLMFLAETFDVLDAGFRQARRQEGFYLQQRTLTFSMPASGKLVAEKAFIFSREL